MTELINIHFVAAVPGEDGKGTFIDVSEPLMAEVAGAIDAAYLWSTPGLARLPDDIGGVPADISPPRPGGSKFGIVCFPAHSAGKLNVSTLDIELSSHPDVSTFTTDDPGMHRTDTIDYEFIISGKIDIVLGSGERRTLRPGSCQMMGGVLHAWENHYDEPCIFAVVMIGATLAVEEMALPA